MKNRFIKTIISAFVLTSLLAGCGQTGTIASVSETPASVETSTETSVAEAAETEEVAATVEKAVHSGELKVSFPVGVVRTAINIVASKKGYFEEEGITIEEINVRGQDALTALNQGDGQLDIYNVGFVPDLQAIGNGYDLKIIGGTAVEGGAIISKASDTANYRDASTVINIDALTNAKLGFVRNESAWVITRQYLLDNGVSDEAIKAIENEETGNILYFNDETAVAQAVQKGEIEIGFLPIEFAILYGDAYEIDIVAEAGELQENYVCCREVTSTATYTEKYDAIVGYERARIRAFEYYKLGETDAAVKAEIVSIVAEYTGKETDYVETYLYGGVTKYATDPNTKGIVKYVEAAANSGLLASAGVDFLSYDITQNIDTKAYKQALEELVNENPENSFYAAVLDEYNNAN